jgi:transglutaminase-like putative cysteine protease
VRVRSPRRPAKAPAKLPVDRAGFGKLAATPTVDHDSPAILALARTLVPKPDGQEPLHVAAVLAGWVNGSLQKVYGASSDRATRVLAEKKGDCTEHALLFVALARASGLPARSMHGLVSAD